jgi:hypothetical protein
MAAPPAKIHLDFAKAQRASSILLTCAIQTATRFALCTAQALNEIFYQYLWPQTHYYHFQRYANQ